MYIFICKLYSHKLQIIFYYAFELEIIYWYVLNSLVFIKFYMYFIFPSHSFVLLQRILTANVTLPGPPFLLYTGMIHVKMK